MIPRDRLVLLDTNVIIEVARNQAIGKRILADLDLLARPERPLVSINASTTGRKGVPT